MRRSRFMDKWKKTETAWGYEPNFPTTCRYCNVPLQGRFSIIYQDYTMILKYKCPECGWFALFEIDEDREYQKKIFELRGKVHTITPTVEELSENKDIERQLTGLGYFGGR